jgi:hypothetical protein
MGVPVTGSVAVVSATGGDVAAIFTALRVSEMSVAIDTDEFDVTELTNTATAVENLTGLMSGTASFSGFYPKASPKVGNAGLVTVTDGYTQYVTDWKLDYDFGEQEITSFNATDPEFKTYMPSGIYRWSGSYNAHAVNDTKVTLPLSPNSLGKSATFNLTDTKSLAGNIITRQLGHAVRKQDKQVLAYSFSGSGACTEAGAGTAIRGNGSWVGASFDLGAGTPNVTFTTYTGRTYTANCFLRSLSIECAVSQVIKISGQLRFYGTIATA